MKDSEQKTLKLDGYKAIARPLEDSDEVKWWHKWLVQIIFGLWNEKREMLAKMGFPPRPIHQKEIFREKCRRVQMLKEEKLWGTTKQYPYSTDHEHNWIERRINYLASEKYGPKTDGGILKIVNVSAGFYAPSPLLFEDVEKSRAAISNAMPKKLGRVNWKYADLP